MSTQCEAYHDEASNICVEKQTSEESLSLNSLLPKQFEDELVSLKVPETLIKQLNPPQIISAPIIRQSVGNHVTD